MEDIELKKLLDERIAITNESTIPESVKFAVSLSVNLLYRLPSGEEQLSQLSNNFTEEEIRKFRTTLAELMLTEIEIRGFASVNILKDGEVCPMLKAAVASAITDPDKAGFRCFDQSSTYVYVTKDSFRSGTLPF